MKKITGIDYEDGEVTHVYVSGIDLDNPDKSFAFAKVKRGTWLARERHERYTGVPYEENVCPFCKRQDHNGDGTFCGYCGAKLDFI